MTQLKRYFWCIMLICLLGEVSAQLTMHKETHVPDIGDKYVVKSLDSADTMGVNYPPPTSFWQFDTIPGLNNLVNNKADSIQVQVRDAANTDYESDFPNADYAQKISGYDSTGSVIDSPANYNFIDQQDSVLWNLGVATPLGNIINYDDNMKSFVFPITYPDSLYDTFSGIYYIDYSVFEDTVETSGYIDRKVLGNGTLRLPFDTFYNTLLIRHKQVTKDTQYFAQTTTTTINKNYHWYISHFEFHVFSIEQSVTISSTGRDTSFSVSYVNPGKLPKQYVSGTVMQPNGADLTDGKVIAYQYDKSRNRYQIVDVDKAISSTGGYTVDVYKKRNLILQVVPDPQKYGGLFPTYLNKTMRWEKAKILQVYNDSLIDFRALSRPSVTSGKGTISGKVVKGSNYSGLNKTNKQRTQGDPLANVNCAVVETGRDSIYQVTTTGSDGKFKFDSLPAGNYDVRAEVPGVPVDTGGLNDFDISSDGNTHKSVQLVVDSDKVTVQENVGIEEASSANEVMKFEGFYPNPGQTTRLQLRHKGKENATYRIEIYSVTGAVMKQKEVSVHRGMNRIPLQLHQGTAGVYFVKITAPQGQTTVRKWLR